MRNIFTAALVASLLLFNFFSLRAQNIVNAPISGPHTAKGIDLQPGELYQVNTTGPVSSVSLRLPAGAQAVGAYILTDNGERFKLSPDPDAPEGAFMQMQLVVFTRPLSSFKLYSGKASAAATLHLLYAKPLDVIPHGRLYKDGLPCARPKAVTQDVWRSGLEGPKVYPTQTEVKHVIIHHTATPNSDTDYTERVRNIYLYHTQVNGWDDIGYNYLIAPDGAVYEGRDGQNVYSDDNVKGAHLCGKNSNTMGISMLGTFSNEAPTDTAIGTLRQLLAWKLNKESLQPTDSSRHPLSDEDAPFLGAVAGHRDGCPTECPGDSMYARIPGLKSDVEKILENCAPYVNIADANNLLLQIKVYPSPAHNTLYVRTGTMPDARLYYSMQDMQGRVLANGSLPGNGAIDISHCKPGLYLLKLADNAGDQYYRKILVN